MGQHPVTLERCIWSSLQQQTAWQVLEEWGLDNRGEGDLTVGPAFLKLNFYFSISIMSTGMGVVPR